MRTKEFSRPDRLGDQVQRELAQVLEFEVGDPRLVGVTVTAVKVSRDLSHARVFVTMMIAGEERDAAMRALRKASGYVRHLLAQRLIARITPQLDFVYDQSVEQGVKLSALIDSAVASDHQRQAQREDAADGDAIELAPHPETSTSR